MDEERTGEKVRVLRRRNRKENSMFDRFGEMSSADEINTLAVNLRKEGDTDSIYVLAKENGIDEAVAEIFMAGDLLYMCDDMAAAIGKIEIEAAELKPVEIMADWVDYLKSKCFEDPEMAKAVRRKGKNLKGAIAALLTWSFKNQHPVDKDILKAAGVTANRCTLGIPGMGRAKKIMSDYYMGK